MIHRTAMLGLTLAALLASTGSAQTASTVAGRYRTDDNNAIITIAPCSRGSAAMCGRISQFLNPSLADARDEGNPDATLRSRRLLGTQILTNLTREGNSWTGRGYSPEEGRNFNATVTPHGNQLRVRGCVAIFCRTVEWVKVN